MEVVCTGSSPGTMGSNSGNSTTPSIGTNVRSKHLIGRSWVLGSVRGVMGPINPVIYNRGPLLGHVVLT